MSNNIENPLDAKDSDAALAYAEERRENIKDFVRTNPDYYIAHFDHIGENDNFTPTLNIMAGLFGQIWFGKFCSKMWQKLDFQKTSIKGGSVDERQ